MDNILLVLDFIIRLSFAWYPVTLSIILYAIYEPNRIKINNYIKQIYIDKYIKRVYY